MTPFRLLPSCLLLGALLLGGGSAQVSTGPAGLPGPSSVTVQPGDTAFGIARRAGLSLQELLTLNHLSSPDLRVGQILVVRGPTAYVVQTGDTLYALARRFGVTVDALLAASALPPGATLRAGQTLTLPTGATLPATPLQTQATPTQAAADLAAPGSASPFRPLAPVQTLPVLQPGSPMPRSQLSEPSPPVADVSDWRAAALGLLNTPYVFGGATHAGTDCSGLILQVFTPLGIPLPRTSAEQARAGMPVAPDELTAGDLVFFDTDGTGRVSHVGIYLGEDQFISANSYQGRVTVDRLRADRYWGPRFVEARRVLPTPLAAR